MRPTYRHFAAALVATLTSYTLWGCQGGDVPMPANGPNSQSFSTNNALIRIVNGSPTAGVVSAGCPSTCVDIEVDGTFIARGVPYPAAPALDPFAILPYVSVPSGPVLIQIFQAGTNTLVFEPTTPLVLSAGKKYSFVLAGNAPLLPPAPPFFPGYLFNDGLFQSQLGQSMATFHNGSPNAGSQQFQVTCTACTGGGQHFGNPAGAGSIVGPVNLIPSANYTLGTTTTSIAASALNGANTGSVLPDPLGKPNVSIYLVDTLGGAGNFQVIGIEDSNG
jgi:hypothetical protein